MSRTALRALTNQDYQDRELLHILYEEGDNEGWASTEDLGKVIRISHPDGNGNVPKKDRAAHTHRCIGSRYSYMTSAGWCEKKVEKGVTFWRVTEIGTNLMAGKLTMGLSQSLDRLRPGDRVLVMRELGRAFAHGSKPEGTILRREWAHSTGRRA